VPWRGGQCSLLKVRLTVSPENCPLIVEACACLDRAKLAGAVPEKLPSGISTKFRIGTFARACDTSPDK